MKDDRVRRQQLLLPAHIRPRRRLGDLTSHFFTHSTTSALSKTATSAPALHHLRYGYLRVVRIQVHAKAGVHQDGAPEPLVRRLERRPLDAVIGGQPPYVEMIDTPAPQRLCQRSSILLEGVEGRVAVLIRIHSLGYQDRPGGRISSGWN